MSKKEKYEGKAKILCPITTFRKETKDSYPLDDYPKDAWIQKFKDDLTAFDAIKKANMAGKGALNQKISKICYDFLHLCGFKTHYLGSLDDNHQVITYLEMIPLECIARRVATGSLVKRLGVTEGTRMTPPLFEIFLKDDALHDPFMGRDHVNLVHPPLGKSITYKLEMLTISIFGYLEALFKECGLELIDGKFEFGFNGKEILQEILLGDEITGDTLRIWKDGKKLDKDVFRHDLGDVLEGYGEILRRLEKIDLKSFSARLMREGIATEPYTIICEVTPQEEVLDPEGQAVSDVLHQTELTAIQEVKMGKRIAMQLNQVLSGHGLSQLEKVGSSLLANPLIQDWQFYVDRV